MAKKQFKTESKRLLDLMINSIYTHKEIFLRELISNASDALDKLVYRTLTDEKVGLNRSDLQITLTVDREKRMLTVSDNGIGMTKEELEANLGVIAKSGSLQFKQDMADAKADQGDVNVIGQFGVGFYSAFMVADKVTVLSRAYGSQEGWKWESDGADGYTITPWEKQQVGTDVIIILKADGEEEQYSEFLDQYRLSELVKKHSDYIRYPIRMEMERSRPKEKAEGDGDEGTPEWETYTQWETLNSMVPLWQRPKGKVTEEEYNNFYKEKFGQWEEPLAVIHTSAEGTVEYQALLYIPGRAPFDFYTREYQKGLQLYSSGVLIMEKCADLLPDHFRFVQGVVDSQDVSLNISREMLQHTRQLKIIATNLEKKVKAELLKLQEENWEKYETFWNAFGTQLKYGVVSEYGAHKEMLKDLLLFWSSREGKRITLKEYREKMPESQQYVYYVSAGSVEQAKKLPQAERILDAGYEVLYLTEETDEFIMQTLGNLEGKQFKSVSDEDALPETDADKEKAEQQAKENQDVLDFVKQVLGERIKEARISRILKSGAVCMTADGPISLEMEKYFSKMEGGMDMKAQRVLELNPEAEAFAALRRAMEADRAKAERYVELLYGQALLVAGLPLPDPVEYSTLISSLIQ